MIYVNIIENHGGFMSFGTINFQIKDQYFPLDLSTYTVSDFTKKILENLGFKLPKIVVLDSSLKGRITSFHNTLEQIGEAKKEAIDQKLFAIYCTALLVSLIAIGAFCLTISHPAATILGIFALGIYAVASSENLIGLRQEWLRAENRANFLPQEEGIEKVRDHAQEVFGLHLIESCLAGLGLPIYEAFTRVSRLEDACKKQKEQIQKDLFLE